MYIYMTPVTEKLKQEIIVKVFEVCYKNGKLGIDWNTERSPYICRGEIFTPFEVFAPSVTFENIETNESYYFSNIKNELEKIS